MRTDGTRFEAEMTARPACGFDGSELGFVNTIGDISERKRYEAALERERRDLNDAQVVAEVGSWDYGIGANILGRWSAQLWHMLGMTPVAAAPTHNEFLQMVLPRDRARVAQALMSARDTKTSWDGEFGMLTADGRRIVVAFRVKQNF